MINYNDLYELLRKEKYAENLQVLPKKFISEVCDFLNEQRSQDADDGDSILGNVGKSKKQLENSIALFKELILRRKKKILNLVFVATETGIMKRDYENMLSFEKDIFDKLISAFDEGDKDLNKIMNGAKSKAKSSKSKLVMFDQDVEEFVDMNGNNVGPYKLGEIANLDSEVADVLVSGGNASLIDD